MNQALHPAKRYSPCPGLWCITAYFNPAHYRTRRANYETFAAPLRAAGIHLLTVECAFGDDRFDLPPGPEVLQVRGRDVLWQKERLINLGVRCLPPQANKVAWLDNDILFTNPDWAVQIAARLDEVAVVQPFEHAFLLKHGRRTAMGDDCSFESFARIANRNSRAIRAGNFNAHGHTGFAWAARRDLLAHNGLYEALLSGNGDHYMAHAMLGDLNSPCMLNLQRVPRTAAISQHATQQNLLIELRAAIPLKWKLLIYRLPGMCQTTGPFWRHFYSWGQLMAEATGGCIGWIPGAVLHLWHGDTRSRGHREGWLEMHRRRFDPVADLRIGSSGCLEWASDKPELHQWAKKFFTARREDDE